ncbi:MAG TPA: agmatine deiminase family protein, partial [Fibrobacteria bacterium]|nr:agmatine deiminase family protein [Fibrobacteria bacterium]
LVAVDFTFNSWGGKYPPWDADDAVPVFMGSIRDREVATVDFVLEGGSIDVNGKGTLLTTSQCLLNPNRNPGLSRGRIEEVLHGWLGIKDTVWLESGIHGDDTDGHVDDLARFTDARTVVVAIETDRKDENYEALKRNVAVLNEHAKRHDLEVLEVPMPARQVKADLRTPATYMNFLILNDAVLVPVFLDKQDDKALALLESRFPGRTIVPIDCRGLVFGQGAIHCSSMQEPTE